MKMIKQVYSVAVQEIVKQIYQVIRKNKMLLLLLCYYYYIILWRFSLIIQALKQLL